MEVRSVLPLDNITYAYDADGNRTEVGGTLATVVLPQATSGLIYDDAGQLVERAGTPLQYDANGNLVDDGKRRYVWNERNQLERIEEGTSGTAGGTSSIPGRTTSIAR